MTNEEITEEIYHEAHANGFIEELRAKVDEFRVCIHHHKLPQHEMVYKAYYMVKPGETNQDLEVFI